MPDLATLQSDFVRALLGSDRESAIVAIDAAPASAALLVAVYRNTALSGLCEALRASYPVTERVLGSAFFEQTALAFVRERPPTEPVLARYGAGFPDFLSMLPALVELPYVADLARLEWAVDQAPLDHRCDSRRFTLAVGDADAQVSLDPSLGLIVSATAVRAIWTAVAAGEEDGLASLEWRTGPEHLAISCRDGEVVVTALSLPAWTVLSALLDGQDLAASVAALDADHLDEAALACEILSAPFIRIDLGHSSRNS